MPVETVIERSCETLGEGPHWDNGTLLYVDINNGVLHRWNSETQVDEKYKFDTSLYISFCIPRKKGGYVIGLGQQISLFDWDTKKVTVLHTVDEGKETKLNDGKCDALGRLWCGTMGLGHTPEMIQPNLGSLYCLDLDGTLTKQKEGLTISNGLAWSLDNTTMYFVDTTPRKVYGFDYDLAAGKISNERVVVDLMDKPEMDYGYPDGMTVDIDDKLWVACYLSGKIIRFDPATVVLRYHQVLGRTIDIRQLPLIKFLSGSTEVKKIGSVSLPVRRPTSCCFGGPNYDELYVTCALSGVAEEEKLLTPLAGSVFKATDIGAKGLPAYVFQG